MILDFAPGTDTIELANAGFNLAGSLVEGTNFFAIGAQFNGTNSGAAAGVSHIVVEGTGTVYHDSDSSLAGYTVIAESPVGTPAIADFTVTRSP